MRAFRSLHCLVGLAIGWSACIAAAAPLADAAPETTLAAVEPLIGMKGSYIAAESVYKFTRPRTDIPVRVDGSMLPPFMGLTSWAAFAPGGRAEVMLAGDIVVFQDEVDPVMDALMEGGVAVTALHNHFFFDDPKVYFMHIGGEGAIETLAPAIRSALEKIDDLRRRVPVPKAGFNEAPLPSPSAIAAEPIRASLGYEGQAKDGMVKVVIGRSINMECGCPAGKEFGVNTWAAFAGADDDAVVDGDFAVLESELQPVLKALRRGGIHVVSIHHHMTGETPRMLFLHYWGRGPTTSLAATLRSALDQQKLD